MNNFIRLTKYLKPYWWRITIAALASTAYGAMDGAFAYFIAPVLNKIFVAKDLLIFSLMPFLVIILFAIRGLCRFANEFFMRSAAQLAVNDIRKEVFSNCLRLDLRFFQRHQTGSLISRVFNDVYVMQDGAGNIITSVFRDGISVISLLVVIFYRDWQLAIISFLAIPLTIYPAQLIGKKIKRVSKIGQERSGDITSILQEAFSGIKVIKAFGLEKRQIDKFAKSNEDFYHYFRKGIKYSSLSAPVIEIITSFGIAGVIFFGGKSVMSGRMTAADFFSFVTAMALVYSPFKKLLSTYNDSQRCLGAAERVFEIIDAQPEIVDPPHATALPHTQGIVEFKNVSFKYADNTILEDINLVAQKGQIIALIGPSGAGKTTLVSLIARFFDVSDGVVTLDSHDVRSIRHSDLVSQLSLVDQETILFNDTIANNIRYGRPDASLDKVEQAARAAYAHDFISAMPEGYETNIGDRGVRLSGGQRQRICIARALLKDAPVLILDEATSALDTESEKMVQEALENLMKNRTTFVIAHRLSTVLHADTILVMDQGRIVERGTHKQLVAQNGLYTRLYEMQFKD
ncbi:lipid A export permease/ATP-binding protein MsbA [Trichlorobacter ammonificans]|uniref:Lipid A export ATP-binding/permease protein MsbA n=1 Tax=Trichlorobacter ammonificans TaxID=2916410 RepID=A0ABN8HCJ1_9BACT|nr:lipid A export permease/ATP-binding protein MsbA [Trichlorobacter ammonificans]CAH2030488.1 Lipid A export ATP-binding/permease protein MsbA [Trichlorobacter ammonificans]